MKRAIKPGGEAFLPDATSHVKVISFTNAIAYHAMQEKPRDPALEPFSSSY